MYEDNLPAPTLRIKEGSEWGHCSHPVKPSRAMEGEKTDTVPAIEWGNWSEKILALSYSGAKPERETSNHLNQSTEKQH